MILSSLENCAVFILVFAFFNAVLFGAVFVLDFDFDAALIPFELDVFGFDARELLDFTACAPKIALKIPFNIGIKQKEKGIFAFSGAPRSNVINIGLCRLTFHYSI